MRSPARTREILALLDAAAASTRSGHSRSIEPIGPITFVADSASLDVAAKETPHGLSTRGDRRR
jgi:hypothetical protein